MNLIFSNVILYLELKILSSDINELYCPDVSYCGNGGHANFLHLRLEGVYPLSIAGLGILLNVPESMASSTYG